MSVHESQRRHKQSGSPATYFSPATLVDTNVILQRAIQKLPPELRNEVVLRCDELVHLQCSEEDSENLFTQLLRFIAKGKPLEKKLFLHITCFPDGAETAAATFGLKRFKLQFHSNSSLHTEGTQEAEKQINSLAAILVPYSGSLQVNQLKNSGCVFSISLPGK